ncbi:MAG TPA: GTP-binding protein, partial [Caldisericia bacterium]|nr:GTP-binding protein [Caldisericia bacterium]
KTSLTESILFISKAIQKKGSVDKGNTVSDFEPEEIKRHISLSTTILPCNWKGYKINLIDTPGYVEFISEVRGGLIASESSIILVDAVGGVEVGTERVWEFAEEDNLPIAFVISRMDRENANFSNTFNSIRQFFGQDAVPFMIPIGEGLNFKGYINLTTGKARILENNILKEIDLPDSEKEKFETYRSELIEKIAEVDEEFLNNYLSNGTLNEDEIKRGLKKGIEKRIIYPVLISSSVLDVGTEEILDFIVNEFPEPKLSEKKKGYDPKTNEIVVTDFDINKPFSGLVFKTIIDPFIGRINFIKVITGKITQDTKIYNVNKEQEERVSGIAFISGKNQEKTSEITAGDIGVLIKLNVTTTGDTLAQNNFPVIY